MTTMFAPYAPAPDLTRESSGMEKFARSLRATQNFNGPLAVLNFEVNGDDARLGELIANQITHELRKSGGSPAIVDRTQVLQALSLRGLDRTGFPAPAELKRLAPLLGAGQFVLGTVTCSGRKGLINAYVVAPSSGMVISRAQMTIRCP